MAQRTTKLAQRTLGDQGRKAGAFGLGTVSMTIAHKAGDEKSSIATVHRACELRVTLFGTAELATPTSPAAGCNPRRPAENVAATQVTLVPEDSARIRRSCRAGRPAPATSRQSCRPGDDQHHVAAGVRLSFPSMPAGFRSNPNGTQL
ncbi:hypothetical protein [Streptomyces sp. NPDC058755]|uniref:hypothetical protein n=1 Tax=Streptomyces sp. NPDC058755 TaxID=3346624 RepID=UPI0036C70144